MPSAARSTAAPLEPDRPAHARRCTPTRRRRCSAAASTTPLPTGVRAIDAALTVGEGQRVGIFAMAGGGKSTLLGMLARQARADVNVIALVGERGREVREFLDESLGEDGLARSVVVVSTSDRPALERVRAAYAATAIAEGFRREGKRVLLLVDSVTRFARGLRELGLSALEPPVRRGYPPSVFAELPRLFERAGNDAHGSITAFYTVLAEDDDNSDPVAEEVRSILDGHIVLSRAAGAGRTLSGDRRAGQREPRLHARGRARAPRGRGAAARADGAPRRSRVPAARGRVPGRQRPAGRRARSSACRRSARCCSSAPTRRPTSTARSRSYAS